MKRILSLAAAFALTVAMVASNATAADWSSSVGLGKVTPNPTCMVKPSSGKAWSVKPLQAKGWSVVFRPASWSDGSSYRSRGLLSFGASKVKPLCGDPNYLHCGWNYLGPDYPYPWLYKPC